jgi:cation diffusion facilitator family transporter
MSKYLEKNAENRKIIKRVAMVTLMANIFLTIAKVVLGIVFVNMAVISDAVHTASDAITTLLVLFAVAVSSPKPDKKHNYGHEKIEPLLILLFALILAGTGGYLFYEGVVGIIAPQIITINYFLIGIIVASLVVKEVLFWYVMKHAKKTKSDMLRAEAWHHRSDSLSSVAVLIGLVCSYFIGTNLAESIAILVVSLLIVKVAVQIAIPAINNLIDKAADEKICEQIKQIAMETPGVKSIDKLQTRMFGAGIYVDIEVCVEGNLTVIESHDIAKNVHDILEAHDELNIKHCNVHIHPYIEETKEE